MSQEFIVFFPLVFVLKRTGKLKEFSWALALFDKAMKSMFAMLADGVLSKSIINCNNFIDRLLINQNVLLFPVQG